MTYEILMIAFMSFAAFIVFSAGWGCGYIWRRAWFKKAETEAVKDVRDYEFVKTENENLREVITRLERDRKILEACNEDMVPHNCQCGKKKVIDDEITMVPIPKGYTSGLIREGEEEIVRVLIFDTKKRENIQAVLGCPRSFAVDLKDKFGARAIIQTDKSLRPLPADPTAKVIAIGPDSVSIADSSSIGFRGASTNQKEA